MTKKENIIEDICGIKVSDPYRWLENPNDDEVVKWISEQNKLVQTSLEKDPYTAFSDMLVRNFKVVNFSNPVPVNGKYFYTERQSDEDQSVLYMREGLVGNPIKIFDPNGKKVGNTMSIDYWYESRTGAYIAYGISEGGNEMATLYIKNTMTNVELKENIPRCRNSSVRWLPGDEGFYYTRNPRPGTVPLNEEHLHTKVYLHMLGSDPNKDELIFGADRPKDDMIGISLSPDGRYFAIQASRTWTENELYIYDTSTKKTQSLIVKIPAKFSLIFLQDKVLIDTNYHANNYRVVWSRYEDMFKPFAEWQELIPEKKFPIEMIRITKSKILIEYIEDVHSRVFIFDHNGKEIGKIPLPEFSSLAGISARRDEEEFFYGVDSYVFPKITYRYDPVAKQFLEYRKTANPINPDDYEIKQEWFASKDGTKVPMFIYHKKGVELDGSNPTILYGYGGFGNSMLPFFMRNWVPWIENGGIFAVANIRGGGEFGEDWHKAGIKKLKQNSFDDFIAAGEYLISRKYTDVGHLGILGGSNGGLLVSAVGVQRPDLWKAICSAVPLTDMVRFSKFGMAVRWVHEYGNPGIKEDLENILKWSPYHNVKEGERYPAFLFTTADKDTRVDPLHSRKMAAQLQGANDQNKVFIYTDTEAGHGSGKPIVKIVKTQAIILTFFQKELGLDVQKS